MRVVIGFAVLETGNFVAAQFAQAAWLGWVALAIVSLAIAIAA